MTSRNTTTSGRIIKKPKRFQDETFVAGSGFVGCDHYDMNYDNGHSYGPAYKDLYQKAQDIQYTRDLEKAMMVQETSQKLPKELEGIIGKFAGPRSSYQSDIAFIASDNIEPVKQIEESDEEEWVSGDETEDDGEWSEYEDE